MTTRSLDHQTGNCFQSGGSLDAGTAFRDFSALPLRSLRLLALTQEGCGKTFRFVCVLCAFSVSSVVDLFAFSVLDLLSSDSCVFSRDSNSSARSTDTTPQPTCARLYEG